MPAARMLHLLDGVHVARGDRREALSESGARLAAFVALHGRTVDRRHVAGSLWPSCGDDRAAANLRSTLWRLAQGPDRLLEVTARSVQLAADLTVDVEVLERWATGAQDGPPPDCTSIELMPGNREPWVVIHRERIRQRVLHALEARSAALLEDGRVAEALALASTALRFDPVRESAVRTLVTCHLASGDRHRAHTAYRRYCNGLHRALAVRPGPRLIRLLHGTKPATTRADTRGAEGRVLVTVASGDRAAHQQA